MTASVMGNHDNALARRVDCGCRGDFKRFSEETRAWHQSLVNDDDRRFLKSLPEIRKITLEGQSILLAHATPAGDLFHYPSDAEVDQAVREVADEIVLLGHTHIQFMRFVDETLVANPGSVGLARDGGSACYAVLLDGKLHLHRLSYNVEQTVAALQRSPVSEATKAGLTRVLRGLPPT